MSERTSGSRVSGDRGFLLGPALRNINGTEMIRSKSVTKTVEEIVSVTCDRCGKEYDALDFEAQEFHHIKFTGGYASIFGDGTEVECDLCQHCLHRMIGDICRRKEAT